MRVLFGFLSTLALLLLAGCDAGGSASSPTHYLVAGTGHEGFSGDGGPATKGRLHTPCGVDMDSKGNLYFADSWNQRIRMVRPDGTLVTLAGTGVVEGTRDGLPKGTFTTESGPALTVALDQPNGIALDAQGNLFIADGGNARIRKLTPQGEMRTVVGDGESRFSGDGGPTLAASLGYPFDVAFDRDGNLYIADSINHRIRKVDAKGIITTFAGNGKGTFAGDGGPATAASLHLPNSIEFDDEGNLFIADEANHRIRKVDTKGIITTVAGNGAPGFSGDSGPALRASLNFPSGLEVDRRGSLFINDRVNHRVRLVRPDGTITTLAGNGKGQLWRLLHGYGDGRPAADVSLSHPRHSVLGPDGSLYFADGGNDCIRKIVGVAAPETGPLP